MNILDRVAESRSDACQPKFRATSPSQVFALLLAQHLDDVAAFGHYVRLTEQYSQGRLLTAYRRAARHYSGQDLARRFHAELKTLSNGSNGVNGAQRRLAAIRIERRTVAVAIFKAGYLEYTQAHQLSSDSEKAVGSAAAFVARVWQKWRFETAVFEVMPDKEVQRTYIKNVITGFLVEQSVSIWPAAKKHVFRAFGHPPLKSRKELREIVCTIWPVVLEGGYGSPFRKDAVALGLYCEIERLFTFEA